MSGLLLGAPIISSILWKSAMEILEAGGYVGNDSLNPAIPATYANPSPSSTTSSPPGLVHVAELPGAFGQDGQHISPSSVSLQLIGLMNGRGRDD